MGPIEDSLREAFFLAFLVGEEVSSDLREILDHSMKLRSLGLPHPRLLADSAYSTSKAAREVLVGPLIGGTTLNYVVHKCCVHRASADGRKHR